MGDTKIIRRAFNAGEISRRAKWRNDVEKHGYACERLENFYVSPLGSISRREGTRLLQVLGESSESDSLRIIPFEYNRELSLALVFHTSQEEVITMASDPFILPNSFTLSVDFSELGETQGELLRKDNLTITRRITEEADQIIFSDGVAMAAADYEQGGISTYRAEFADGTMTIFKDGQETASEDFDIVSSASPLYMYKLADGEDRNLQIFNGITHSAGEKAFDASSYTADYGSTILYQNGEIEIEANGIANVRALAKAAAATATFDYRTYDYNYANLTVQPPTGYICTVRYNADKVCGGGDKVFSESTLAAGEKIVLLGRPSPETAGYGGLTLERFEDFLNFSGNAGRYEYGSNEYPEGAIGRAGFYGAVFALSESFGSGGEVVVPDGFDVYGYVIFTPAADYDAQNIPSIVFKHCQYARIEEKISVPFELAQGYAVNYSADISATSASAAFDTAELQSYQSLPDAAQSVVFTLIHTDAATPEFSGSFDIEASLDFYSFIESSSASEHVVYCDVYDIGGNAKAKDMQTPIPQAALQDMQYKQVGGDIYFAHRLFAPKKISIAADGNFSWAEAVEFQPSLDEPQDVVLSCDAAGEVIYAGEIRTITADKNFFTQDMVGRQIKIDYVDSEKHVYEWQTGYTSATRKFDIAERNPELFESFKTPAFVPCGQVKITPQGGIWDGILILEESTDGGQTWNEIGRTSSIQGSDNTAFIREIYDVKSLVRARMLEMRSVVKTSSTKIESANEGCFFTISIEGRSAAWVEVYSVGSATQAKVRFINPSRAKFTSSAVYLSAWSGDYPRAVEIHEERLVFAGNRRKPSTVWLSQTNNWGNFRSVSNLDTDPLSYTLASDDGEPISWLVSRSDLMIGMGSSEWSLGSRDSSQALTASIVHASSQSDDGVEYVMPAKAGGMVVFVRRGNRELASITYDFANDAYNASSLCTMHPDLLAGGVVNIFNQLSPSNKIYCVLKKGQVAVFTYDKENNVAAWSRFIFGDGVLSACALSSGIYRSVFLIVRRGGYLCLERLDPNEAGTGNWLDCVPISADMELPLDFEHSVKFESAVKTTPVFLQGFVKVVKVSLFMLNSFGGKYRISGYDQNGDAFADKWQEVSPREGEVFDYNYTPRDYRFNGACDTGYLEEGAIEVATDTPAPFELAAIGLKAKG